MKEVNITFTLMYRDVLIHPNVKFMEYRRFRMKCSRFLILFMVVLAVIALQACGGSGGGNGGSAQTGAVQLSLTDAPGDFDHVYITVKDVWFHTSDVADPRASDWLKYPLSTPVTLDLLSLANGNMQSIWNNIQLPIGNYQQIRIFLVPTYTSNPPSGHQYYNEVVVGSSTYPLYIPDADHGIKLVGTFSVAGGGTLKLAIDFDAGHDDTYPSYSYPYQYPYGGYGSSSPSVMIISNNPYGYAPPAPEPPPPPVVREYSPTTAPAQAGKYEEPLYLIASHDGTIRAVLAYWVDGATVHYVTMDHEQKQTPLSSIDRMLSERLNRERNVTFRLPG